MAESTRNTDGLPTRPDLRLPDAARRRYALGAHFPLLLALANDEPSPAAIRLTQALAQAKGAVPTVVRALADARAAEEFAQPVSGAVVEEYVGPAYVTRNRAALETQLASVAGAVDWQLEVSDAFPIDAIVERASRIQPALIVMGLRRHGVLQRVLSRDLLAEVVRRTRVPVFAVRPDLMGLPRRIVVAVDFGGASIHAAHLARQLLADDGALFLVHVRTGNSSGVREELDGIIADLAPSPAMTMTSIVLHGDVHSTIESYAQAVDADLLALGSEDHSLLERLATGSISMKLARTARWSTLIVPSRSDDATPRAVRA